MGLLTNYFKGRVNRSSLLAGGLYYSIVYLITYLLIPQFLASLSNGVFIHILQIVVFAVIVFLGISINVRRLHDLGLSGWWILLIVIPIVNSIMSLYLLFRKGNEYTNKYGVKPIFDNKFLIRAFIPTSSEVTSTNTLPSVSSNQAVLIPPTQSSFYIKPILSLTLLCIAWFIIVFGLGAFYYQNFVKPIDYKIREIEIVPIGDVLPEDVALTEDITKKSFPSIEVNVIDTMGLPKEASELQNNQYNAETILKSVQNLSSKRDVRIIGITEKDLYTPGLNFVFSSAKPKGNSLIISLFRLKDKSDSLNLVTETRYKKVLLRALGITFGFKNSSDRSCVMAFSNSLEELDQKGIGWCGSEVEAVNKITSSVQ